MAVQRLGTIRFMTTFIVTLMLLYLIPSNTQACSLNPVAQIASPVNEDVHYTGEAVLFNGSASVAMCGTITSYTWRVRNGGFGAWTQVSTSPTYWHTFASAGTSWQVQLQVHNSVGRTHTRTITGMHVNNAPESQYYLTDHLGSVRAVVNRDGDLLSWSDYYPFGLPMPTRSGNTSNAHDMIKFTGYEAEDEGDLGWYHAEARTYDPFIGRFTSIDPHASTYPSFSPYVYVANNPLRFIDPDGRDIRVAQNEDGTYTIVGGILNDDTGIYLDKDGEKGAFIGNSITTHSFYGDDGNPVLGAVIDLNSTEGQDFLDNLVAENPGLIEYITNAGNNGIYDFKAQGSDDRGNLTRDQHHYRGSVATDGSVGSARDFGNIGAGIVAGRQGLSWGVSRIGFDGYQMATNLRSPSVEGPTTQKAQRVGHNIGVGLRTQRPQPTIVPRLVP